MQKQEEVPVIGMEGFPLTQADLAEEIAWQRKLRWLNLWHWPGWTVMGTVGQVVILMILFLYSGPLLRLIDPTASAIDPGVISELVLSVLLVDTFVISAWLLMRLIRTSLTEFYEWNDEYGYLKKGITSCLEAKILTGIFSGLVLLFFAVFLVLL